MKFLHPTHNVVLHVYEDNLNEVNEIRLFDTKLTPKTVKKLGFVYHGTTILPIVPVKKP